jgi:alkylhydroperoxidase family enzyme
VSRYAAQVQSLKDALTAPGGDTAVALRRALLEGRISEAPASLAPYLEKVRLRAWTITDEDVDALKRQGYTEDQIFEVTTTAAIGAALMRMDRAMAVLKESAR